MDASNCSSVEEQKHLLIEVKPVIVSRNVNDFNLSNIQLNLMIEVSSVEEDNTNLIIRNKTGNSADELFDDPSEVSASSQSAVSLDPLLFVPLNGVQYMKPPFTYRVIIAALIQMSENKALNVGQIYRGFRDLFPYFYTAEVQWRNSVRHCLSFTNWFVKSDTHTMPVKGYKWLLNEEYSYEIDNERRRRCVFKYSKLQHCLAAKEAFFKLQKCGLISERNYEMPL